ncbi:MAG: aldehyde ferredoxin oxidoreductase family protein [Candidatus Riflebacteria bacterium]|nr:aldehyde ferredoxin oxidoreductase family protein [Candidatus Riflebacteria bacterium]
MVMDLGGGYAGRMLRVQRFVGGCGVAAGLFADHVAAGRFGPTDPANPLIVMTGPLCGTSLPAVARFTVSSRSPLTGLWGESNVGGYFGAELKFAGLDGIVIVGRAAAPAYLFVHDGGAELEPAGDLWGKDAYEVCDLLAARHRCDTKPAQVFTIGPAGERGALYAAIVNRKHHVAGRTGMGTVMGSKNLKAVVVSGRAAVPIADKRLFEEVKKRVLQKMRDSIVIESLREAGTLAVMDPGILMGDVPIKNWQVGEWDAGYEALCSTSYGNRLQVGRKTCFACPVVCKREVEVTEGRFKVARGAGPEYETVASRGMLCFNSDLEAVARASELANRYGLDTITLGATIAFAMECFEHGLITTEQTGGLDLTWGNAETIVRCVELTGEQEGFGKLLGLGSARMADAIGRGAHDFLACVRKLEAPMHDPRAAHGMGLAYATGPRGACHVSSLNMALEHGMNSYPEIGLDGPFEERSSQGKARLTKLAQDLGQVALTSASVCQHAASAFGASDLRDMLDAVTGVGWTLPELMECGERIWMLKRALSHALGSTGADDRLTRRMLTALSSGGASGSVPDMELMLGEYYELRGLDRSGRPTRETLDRLGLADLAGIMEEPR